jgi:hypothetical protein
MKMDAMIKRRMWKVAIGHFVLSGTVFLLCEKLELNWWIFGIFQPQFVILITSIDIKAVPPFWYLLPFCLAPAWSICFGWIFVKLVNWLNHFPVLGKRVF